LNCDRATKQRPVSLAFLIAEALKEERASLRVATQ
jgi:hypothetical protein